MGVIGANVEFCFFDNAIRKIRVELMFKKSKVFVIPLYYFLGWVVA